MEDEFLSVIDLENFMEFIEPKFRGIDSDNPDFEKIITIILSIKIFDLIQNLFKPEFQLQEEWHNQEIKDILRKLGRCATLKQKRSLIDSKLQEQEIIFNDYEYFEIIEEYSDATTETFFKTIQNFGTGFKKTSRWLELNEKEKHYSELFFELPQVLPKINEISDLSPQQIRSIIISRPALYLLFQKFNEIRKGNVSISEIILKIIADIFYFYFQSRLNKILIDEYKRLLPPSEYEILETENVPNNDFGKIEWQGTQKELAELFLELYRKGFISEIPVKLIKQFFTKSNTIDQVLKPNQDPKTKDNTYEGIYTPAYRPRFDSIRQKS